MRPRKFKYRIEVWRVAPTEDGFGGHEVNSSGDNGVLLNSSWCNVSSIPTNKFEQFGLDEVKSAIRVRVRKRNDLDYNRSGLFFKYKGIRYTINQVTEIDLEDYQFEIIASISNGSN